MAEEPKIKRRRPWLASLLSLLLPGLGHIYSGRPRRAFAFVAMYVLFNGTFLFGLLPAWKLLLLPAGFWLLVAVLFAYVAGVLYAIIDAWLCARKTSPASLSPYQRWYVYLGAWLFFAGPSALFDTDSRRPIEPYNMPSRSMTPNMREGDYFFAINGWYSKNRPVRGEIAIFKHPQSDIDYIKRIVGLPRDRIQIRGGILYLNDVGISRKPVGEGLRSADGMAFLLYEEQFPDGNTNQIAEISDAEPLDDTDALTVPDGHVFVMGDNRDNSLDSRSFGPVPIANLTDKPASIYWSRDWSRIGMVVR